MNKFKMMRIIEKKILNKKRVNFKAAYKLEFFKYFLESFKSIRLLKVKATK